MDAFEELSFRFPYLQKALARKDTTDPGLSYQVCEHQAFFHEGLKASWPYVQAHCFFWTYESDSNIC